jgi:hypothetical protein
MGFPWRTLPISNYMDIHDRRLLHGAFAPCSRRRARRGNVRYADVVRVSRLSSGTGPMKDNNGIPADQLRADWRKSTWSNPSGDCVEVAALPDGGVAVRNSRHPSGPALVYTRSEIRAFLAGAKNGEFDDLT